MLCDVAALHGRGSGKAAMSLESIDTRGWMKQNETYEVFTHSFISPLLVSDVGGENTCKCKSFKSAQAGRLSIGRRAIRSAISLTLPVMISQAL